MPLTYEFRTVEELVRYLDTRAKDFRAKAQRCHPRSHDNARHGAAAAEDESLVAMIRASNLTVLSPTDIQKLASNGR